MAHLWEPDHAYYAGPINREDHDTWAAFIEHNKGTDWERNIVVRWDWNRGNDSAADDGHDSIQVTVLAPRKGHMWTAFVAVTDSDEYQIHWWLQERWHALRDLWAPVSDYEFNTIRDLS